MHWRPKDYWPANTKVSVAANMYGVDYGNGNWGRADETVNFTIGRKIVTIADVNSFRLRVLDEARQRDQELPGVLRQGRQRTRDQSGTHIVQGKYPEYSMCNAAFNYCGVDVDWAVRINNNGEFIHENNSTIPYQGKANVSHGCVNMSEANAKDYYDLVVLGDPVEVSGTNSPLTAADYVYDWSYATTRGSRSRHCDDAAPRLRGAVASEGYGVDHDGAPPRRDLAAHLTAGAARHR